MQSRVRANIWRRTALVVALAGVFGHVSEASGEPLNVTDKLTITGQTYAGDDTPITVGAGGVLTGNGATISGSAYDLLLVTSGGEIDLTGLKLTNNLDSPNGQNGRAIAAKGADASAKLTDATITISAKSTDAGVDYAHAFTAGVGAADGGSVELIGGSVDASGSKRTVGIQANDGGSISATGTSITTQNHFGHAVQAYSNPNLDPVDTLVTLEDVTIQTNGDNYAVGIQSANQGARVEAVDTTITTIGTNSFGVEVANGATLDYRDGEINTEGQGAAGVRVYGGNLVVSEATLNGTTITTKGAGAAGVMAGDAAEPYKGDVALTGVHIQTNGDQAAGLSAAYGSEITSTGSTIETNGSGTKGQSNGSHGARAEAGGSISLSGDHLTVNGDYSYGLYATGKDANTQTPSSIVATNTTIETEGLYGFGARAESGGQIELTGGSIETKNEKGKGTQDGDGSRAYALSADGADSSISAKGTQITTQGQRAYGAYATNGGRVELDSLTVTTHGFMAYGLYASGAGSLVDATNVNVNTDGSVGDAIWAYQGGEVTLDGGSILVKGEPNVNSPHETANGLVAAGGTNGTGDGVINAKNMTIVTEGANSVGAVAGGLVGTAETSGTVNLENSSITVKGEDAIVADVSYGGTFTATDATLVSEQGAGIVIHGDGNVSLDGTSLASAGASLVSYLKSPDLVQNITVGSGSNLTVNNGTLLEVHRSAEGMDGTVNLTLKAGSVAYGDIVDLDGLESNLGRTGETNFTVDQDAIWSGIVRGINDSTIEAGASFTDNGGAPITGNVSGAENSTIVFTNGADIGGSVSVGQGGQASFMGTTEIGGDVVGSGANMQFSGPTTIVGGVSATSGGEVAFSNTATIGGNVVGDNADFHFSQTQGATIGGNVGLINGSSISGGSASTPIMVAGNLSASSESVVGGNLDVGGVLSAAGATIRPGNSVGVQSYGSIADFGSLYEVEVNAAGASDLVIAETGNVDISATDLTVGQENGNGGYRVNHDYLILQTVDGNVIGPFASAALDSSFDNTLVRLDPVKYDLKNVYVSLSVDQDKVSAARQGLTSNQSHTLDGALSVAGQNGAADAALTSTDPASALDQLSGEVHASVQSALLQNSSLVRRAVGQRLAPGAAAGSALWAQLIDGESTLGVGKSGVAEARTTQGGLFVGGDAEVFQGWRIGGALGYIDSRTKVDSRDSRADTKSYTAALYAGKSWPMTNGNALSFLAGTAYTHHDVDTHRDVTLDGGQSLKADYSGKSAQVFSELGYGFSLGANTSLTPYVGLAWIHQDMDGFKETGGSAALSGKDQTDDLLVSRLGMRGQTSVTVFGTQAELSAGAAWVHASGDVDPSRSVAFVEGGGANFRVAGAPVARDAAAIDFGAAVQVGKTVSVGLGYNGQFGGGQREHGASVFLKAAF